MSEEEKKEILKLMRLVDSNKDEKGKPLFRGRDIFKGWLGVAFISLLVIVFFVIALLSVGAIFRLVSSVDSTVVTLSLLAVALAFFSFTMQVSEETLVEVRFQKALKLGFTENEKLILKALIKIKNKHPKFALEEVYKKHKDMFTKKKLVEELYD